jgi:flavin prenyltransferase
MNRRIVLAISGASGAIYGVRMAEVLSATPEVELHLIISRGAAATISYETNRSPDEVAALADAAYDETEMASALASGTFITSGMVIAPCSIRTLSSIANSANDNLVTRAADVHLKERRRLVLMVRETPLHAGHLRLMSEATAAGAVILPPVPGFYIRPTTLDEIVDHSVGKTLDLLGVDHALFQRWTGPLPPDEATDRRR